MKRILAIGLVVLAAIVAAACSDGSASTPVAPEQSGLQSATADARSNSFPVKLCHQNPDVSDLDPAWVVIEVDDRRVNRHCQKHGDFEGSVNQFGSCPPCTQLDAMSVGDDCSACFD